MVACEATLISGSNEPLQVYCKRDVSGRQTSCAYIFLINIKLIQAAITTLAIEKRIEEVSAKINANTPEDESDSKPSKRPRKTRL